MISLNLDQETEHTINANEMLTYVEYLEREVTAREKTNTTNPLNKAEMLLIYICYFVDKVFPNEDSYNTDNATPLDIALINHIFIKLAETDMTYEDRNKWLSDTVKLVYEVYFKFLTDDNPEKLFIDGFAVMDNLIYNMVLKTADMRAQPWEYISKYDKNMIPILFAKYMNGYLETINEFYDDDKNEDVDIDNLDMKQIDENI